MNSRNGTWLRRIAGVVLGGMVALGMSQPARAAFIYNPGDVIGVFVEAGTEAIVNLGQRSALSTLDLTFATPTAFGSDGVAGSKLIVMQTEGPFSGFTGQNMTFSVEGNFDPSSLNDNFTDYVSGIPNAQASTDSGGATGWFRLLPNFPGADPSGKLLVIPASNASSYSSVLASGGDHINGSFPTFSVANPITGASSDTHLWRAVVNANFGADSTLLGSIHVQQGAAAGTTRVTGQVPEPAVALLLAAGLTGLACMRRRHPVA